MRTIGSISLKRLPGEKGIEVRVHGLKPRGDSLSHLTGSQAIRLARALLAEAERLLPPDSGEAATEGLRRELRKAGRRNVRRPSN